MKIYIAGKVTGENRGDVFTKFNTAAWRVRQKRHEAVNPLDFCKATWSWEKCMKECIGRLVECDAIFLLPDWARSEGARVEYYIAKALNMKIITNYNEL